MEYPVFRKEPVAEQDFAVRVEVSEKLVVDDRLPDIPIPFPVRDDLGALYDDFLARGCLVYYRLSLGPAALRAHPFAIDAFMDGDDISRLCDVCCFADGKERL